MDFDSNEELYFSWYLDELQGAGYIDSYDNQFVFNLSADVDHSYTKPMKRVEDKEISYSLMKGHIYTTDFIIHWNEKAKGIFYDDLLDPPPNKPLTKSIFIAMEGISYIEIKPKFDFKNMTRLVKLNIKWVWDKHSKYVHIMTPEKLFKDTFTPNRFLLTDKSFKKRTIKFQTQTLDEFLQHIRKR
jgi:hypothetical protein